MSVSIQWYTSFHEPTSHSWILAGCMGCRLSFHRWGSSVIAVGGWKYPLKKSTAVGLLLWSEWGWWHVLCGSIGMESGLNDCFGEGDIDGSVELREWPPLTLWLQSGKGALLQSHPAPGTLSDSWEPSKSSVLWWGGEGNCWVMFYTFGSSVFWLWGHDPVSKQIHRGLLFLIN